MNQSEKNHINLVLMAKAPRPGYVKTRLHAIFSHQQACDIYQRFLSRVRALSETWQQSRANIDLFIAYDPPDQPECWKNWHGWKKLPQSSGNLGDRLLAAFASIAPDPADPVIFIGADAPELSMHHLDWAADNLLTGQAAVVPAHDGGYVLIGVHSSALRLFADIEWGTDKVMSKTMEIAHAAGVSLVQSLPVSDIDTAEDLASLLDRLLCSSDADDQALADTLVKITQE